MIPISSKYSPVLNKQIPLGGDWEPATPDIQSDAVVAMTCVTPAAVSDAEQSATDGDAIFASFRVSGGT